MIDYPGRAHPFIADFLTVIGDYGYLFVALLLLAFVAVFSFEFFRNTKFDNRSRWFIYSVTLLIVWGRLPSLLLEEQNPDESYWIVLGGQLAQGFQPYVNVDPGTGGVLVPGLLSAVNALGVPLNYTTARIALIALCLVPSFFLLFYALMARCGPLAARFAILFAAAVFAFPDYHRDLIAYNSEFVALPVLSAILYLHSRFSSQNRYALVGIGFLSAMTIWIKLQSLPIVFAFGILVLFEPATNTGLWNQLRKRIVLLVVGAIVFTVIPAVYFFLTPGAFHNYITSAFLGNLSYVQQGVSVAQPDSVVRWLKVLTTVWAPSFKPLNIAYYLLIAFITFGLLRAVLRRERPHNSLLASFFVFVLTYVACATPGNAFTHYLIFFLPAATLLCAELFNYLKHPMRTRDLAQPLLAVAVALLSFNAVFSIRNHRLMGFQPLVPLKTQSTYSGLIDHIRNNTDETDRVEIWGWAFHVYIQSNRLPNGLADCYRAAMPSPVQEHYLELIRKGIESNPPPYIVDCVTSRAFILNDTLTQRITSYPMLKSVIDNDYELDTVLNERLVYKRRMGS